MNFLTDNFTLEELTKSQTAKRFGFDEQYTPSQQVINNLTYLVEQVLEPIRAKFGSFSPTCAYRSGRVNNKVGGAKASFHLYGQAADIDLGSIEKNRALFDYIKSKLPFTELINEFDYDWIHVGIAKGREKEKVCKYIHYVGKDKVTDITSKG